MGVAKRDRESERVKEEGERKQQHCNVLWVSNDGEREKTESGEREREGARERGRCSDGMRKPRETRSVRVLQGNRHSVTSKKPVVGDTERSSDPWPLLSG